MLHRPHKGWLQRQLDEAKAEVITWPEWKQMAAKVGPKFEASVRRERLSRRVRVILLSTGENAEKLEEGIRNLLEELGEKVE